MARTKFDRAQYDRQHFESIEMYVKRIKRIYYSVIRDASLLASGVAPIPGRIFSFEENLILRQRADAIFQAMYTQMLRTILSGTQESWMISVLKNDQLVNSIFDTTAIPKDVLSKYMNRNLNALQAFQNRKAGGLNLSERIWRQTMRFKTELELGLDIGIGEGKSATSLATQLKANLNEPDMLFRRVRNKYGNLQLSKAAEAYNPGAGVYRSSYRNALRLTRTEINMSYRSADHERYQQLDFVVGYEVKRSNNITDCDICGPLAGKYPKTFKFVGWHPQCRCFVVSILATNAELNRMEQMLLNGEDTSGFHSSNEIKQPNAGYTNWITKNNDRILRAKSIPYFIRDNQQF